MTDMFLKVGGIDGGSADPDHTTDFDALGYSFNVDQLVTVLTDASAKADVRLSPLVVDLVPGAAGTIALLEAIARETTIDDVVLTLRGSDGPKAEVLKISLSGAHVIAYGETGGAATRLAFDFDKVKVDIAAPAGGKSKSYTLDTTDAVPGRTVSVDGTIDLDSPLPKGQLGTLTLDVPGYNGGSGSPGHAGEFNLAGYSFDFTNFGALASQKTLTPLVVDFTSAPRDLARLLDDGSDKAFLGEVTLTRDLGSKGSEVITILDTEVFSYSQANGDSRMALGYSAVHVEYRNGAGNVLSQFDFDVADREDWSLDRGAAEIVRVTGSLDGSGKTAFLSVAGVEGDVATGAYANAFKAQAFHFDFSQLSAAKPSYSPLVVDVDPRALAIPDLVGMMAKGQDVGAVTLAVLKGGGSAFEFEKVRLDGACLIGVDQKDGFATRLVFGYDKAALTLSELDAQGRKKDTTWTFLDPADNRGAVGKAIDTDAALPFAGSDTRLLVKIDGVDGPSKVAKHLDNFEVESFDLGIDSLDAAGKPDLAPLVLNFAAGQGQLTKLLSKMIGNTTAPLIPNVTLHRVDGQGNVIEEVKLVSARVAAYTEAGGRTQAALVYEKIDVQRFSYDRAGKKIDEGRFTLDATKAGASFDLDDADRPAMDAGGGLDMHLKLDGVAGSSTNAGFAGQFDILGYGFELANRFKFGGTAGPTVAEFGASTFVMDFAPGAAGLAALLANLGSGDSARPFRDAVLDIRKPGSDFSGTAARETIALTNLRVTAFDEGDGHATRVTFAYTKLRIEQKFGKDATGKDIPSVNADVDVPSLKIDRFLAPPRNLGQPEPASKAAVMELAAIGIDARSDVMGENPFKILSYDFDAHLTGRLSDGGSNDTTALDASPLTVTVGAEQTGLADLLDRVSGGAALPTLALSLGKDGGAPYETITLKNAVVTGVRDAGNGATQITFGYGQVDLAIGGDAGARHALIDLKTANLIGGTKANDAIDGGGGIDTLSFASLKTGVVVNLATDAASGTDVGTDTVANVENVIGGKGADTITGTDGANNLQGGDGGDVLDGGKGNDRLSGGAGDDTAVFAGNQGDFALANLGNGNLQVSGADFTDTLTGIEKLRFNNGTFTVADILAHSPVLTGGIDDQFGGLGEPLEFSFSAQIFEDSDSDIFSEVGFSASLADGKPLPAWLSFEVGTLTFSGTPKSGDQGSYALKVTATDPEGFASSVTFSLQVDGPPIFVGPKTFSLAENGRTAETLKAKGGDGPLAFSIKGGADAKLFAIDAKTGALTFKAPPNFEAPADRGANNVYDVEVGVSDGQVTVKQAIAIKVVNVVGNTITGTSKDDLVDATHGINGKFATVEEDVIAGGLGSDRLAGGAGNDRLDGGAGSDTLVLSGARADYTFTRKSATSWAVAGRDGTDTVSGFETVKFSNATLGFRAAANAAPKLVKSIAAQAVSEDNLWRFQMATGTFADTDADALSFSARLADGGVLPSWLKFDAAQRLLTGQPPKNFNGAINLKVTASDGLATASGIFKLTVTPVNDAPRLTGAKAVLAAGREDKAYTVSAASLLSGFTDADGDRLAVVNLKASHGAVKVNAGGTFTITPEKNYHGAVALSYGVSDGKLVTAAKQGFVLGAINDAPVITSGGGKAAAALKVAENKKVAALLKAGDADGDKLAWSIAGGVDAKLFVINKATGALSFKAAPDFEKPGDVGKNNTYDVKVKVSDGKAFDTQALTVKLADVKGVTKTGTAKPDTFIGTKEADVLNGVGRADTLKGGGGDDRLIGGAGADKLYGGDGKIGMGADIFAFTKLSDSTAAKAGRDTIFDFAHDDRFDLSAIDANGIAKGRPAFTFIGTDAFGGHKGELRFDKGKSDTFVYADVNGDKHADFGFHLDDALTLVKGDFVL